MRLDCVDNLLRLHEGLELLPYRCSAGKLTIGYGHNIDANGVPDWLENECAGYLAYGISRPQAERLLREDIDDVLRIIGGAIPVFTELSDVRQAVLIDMCFNMGWPTLSGFKRMLAAVSRFDFEAAATEMQCSAWFHQVGDRSRRLVAMMCHGLWPVM